MKRKVLLLGNLFCLFIVFFASCDKDDTASAKSSGKQITEFKIIVDDVEIIANIIEEAKKINAIVPSGTDLEKLTPLIKASEKSTVTPGSGAQIDFSNPVNYIVNAQDGSAQTYVVTITKQLKPTITSTSDNSSSLGKIFTVYGTNLKMDGFKSQIKFVYLYGQNKKPIFHEATPNDDGTELRLVLPESLPIHTYLISVVVDTLESDDDEILNILDKK